jgi:hypothetical protein
VAHVQRVQQGAELRPRGTCRLRPHVPPPRPRPLQYAYTSPHSLKFGLLLLHPDEARSTGSDVSALVARRGAPSQDGTRMQLISCVRHVLVGDNKGGGAGQQSVVRFWLWEARLQSFKAGNWQARAITTDMWQVVDHAPAPLKSGRVLHRLGEDPADAMSRLNLSR